jgi:hypothetical protein
MRDSKLNNPYQISTLIEAQATYYVEAGMIQIYIPKQPAVKHGQGYEIPTRARLNRLEDDAGSLTKETNLERSIRRSKKLIRDYALCNCFDMFITFTFATDRDDVEKCRRRMMDWLKNQRNRNGKFRYLIVPEFHKDGKSIHFHALIGGYEGKIEKAINPKTNKQLKQKGRYVYQLSGYTLGFNNVKLIGNTIEDRTRVASYIQKYMTKDMPVFFGRKRYWVSKGLKLPLVEDNPEHWYKHVTPDWSKEFENGTVMRFIIGKNALVDMFFEAIEK